MVISSSDDILTLQARMQLFETGEVRPGGGMGVAANLWHFAQGCLDFMA